MLWFIICYYLLLSILIFSFYVCKDTIFISKKQQKRAFLFRQALFDFGDVDRAINSVLCPSLCRKRREQVLTAVAFAVDVVAGTGVAVYFLPLFNGLFISLLLY